jgi:1,2-phenylacetyl-CoA epoxidase catalytic subunit
MLKEERQKKIKSYGQAYDMLTEALKRFPKESWHYRPAPDRWTIHEIINHITDSEANSYVRCRRFIAEPGEHLMAYDENQWAKILNYPSLSTDLALELFRWLRQASYELIQTIAEKVWKHEAYHPEIGTMTLNDWLEIYERHVRDHIAQMEENYQHWNEHGDK